MEIKKITVKGITYDIKDSLPAGGEAGQVLKKASGADYDTEWGNEKSGGDSAVLYTAQTLTDEQKTQARANIGAGTVTDTDLSELSDAFYADLENKQALLTPGENITITENGVISASGGVQSVNGKTGVVQLTASDVGALPDTTVIPAPYVLPTASAQILGGVKIGDGITVKEDGTVSVSGG